MCIALPYEVLEVRDDGTVAVRRGDRVSTATLLAVDEPVRAGDRVLVHSGLVLARLTERDVVELEAHVESVGEAGRP